MSSEPHVTSPTISDLEGVRQLVETLRRCLRAAVMGRDDVIDLMVVALLADGHVLLEDYPGSGKTRLAKALGRSVQGEEGGEEGVAPFRRVQFTPDLLPGDITGTTIFDAEHNRFFFRPGPIFAHVVLADEINRASPKVQSALLEAMAEKQVTVDNRTRALDPLFMVIATQNPLDLAGTFPLPRAQLDRFLFKIRMTHIDRRSELTVLENLRALEIEPGGDETVAVADVLVARRLVRDAVFVAPAMREALVDLAEASRADERALQGLSTRSLVLAVPALQARALLQGRQWVGPDDLEALASPLFAHRLELASWAGSEDEVLGECLAPALERLARKTVRR